MSQGPDTPDTISDGETYPLSLASAFPKEDLAYLDRRLQEDAGRLFRNDKLRLELQTFSRSATGNVPVAEAIVQEESYLKRGDDDLITDEATFRIQFRVLSHILVLSEEELNVGFSDSYLEAYSKSR